MSRPGVTYQEVAEAASQLMGQGRNPTIEQIRLILGTGSSTTIANHLKHWKEQQNGTSLLAVRENIPEELVGMLQGLWQRVIDHSEEKMVAIEVGLQQQLQASANELEKYKHNNHRWQLLFNQWSHEKEGLLKTNAMLSESVQALENEKAGMQSTLNGQRQQLQEKQDRINELFRLHKQAQANLEYDREVMQKQFEVLQLANDTLAQKYSRVLTDLTAQSSQLLATEDALQQKLRENDVLKQQLNSTVLLNKKLENEKWDIAQEKAKLEGQLKEREILSEKGLVFE